MTIEKYFPMGLLNVLYKMTESVDEISAKS